MSSGPFVDQNHTRTFLATAQIDTSFVLSMFLYQTSPKKELSKFYSRLGNPIPPDFITAGTIG